MLITFLGNCANQTAHKEGVSFIVENKTDMLLVDAGPGIVGALQRNRKRASDIDNIFITHTHGDHILGFAYFVWNRNFERAGMESPNNLNVYGNEESIKAAKMMVEQCYPNGHFSFEVIYNIIEDKGSFAVGNMKIIAISADHLVPTMGCVIECEGKLLSYSADSLPTEKLALISQNADVLIHEGMFTAQSYNLSRKVKHSLAYDAGKLASSIHCKQLLLVHIAPEMFGNEEKLLVEAASEFDGIISIPSEGSIYIV